VPKARWLPASARITAMEQLWNAFLGAPVDGLLLTCLGAGGVIGTIHVGSITKLLGGPCSLTALARSRWWLPRPCCPRGRKRGGGGRRGADRRRGRHHVDGELAGHHPAIGA
jgi:hypothetical protein